MRVRILDESWWQKVQTNIAICSPVVSLLRLVDESRPVVGKVYFKMYKLGEELKGLELEHIDEQQIQELKEMFDSRWKMVHTDLHAAGFILDPEYNSPQYSQETNAEVMDGFINVVEKMLNADDQIHAMNQLATFRSREGIFARPLVQAAAKTMPAHKWWSQFGDGVPALKKVAVRVLAQVTASSDAEKTGRHLILSIQRRETG